MIWYALLIPVIIGFLGKILWNTKISWQNLIIPIVAGFLTILISYYTLKERNIRDVEYNGHLIVKARYYEYWSTWVEQTCSYTTTCCCDSKGQNCQTTTHYYDCSYCDRNSAYYEAYLENGTKISISKEKFYELKTRWGNKWKFVELDRSINRSGGCGEDGDAYDIFWDESPETAETYVNLKNFRNPVKISHSAFRYMDMSVTEADSLKLYHYPDFYNNYKQRAILSKDWKFHDTFYHKFEYLNAKYGPINKVKVFTLLFKNKPIDIAFQQEQYWQGGNQNEIVVCIGIDEKFQFQWVKVFSWCDNKRVSVEIREDLMEIGWLDANGMCKVYKNTIESYFHYKSFKDFNYLKFEPTMSQLLWVYFITLIISILSLFITYKMQDSQF